MAISDPQEVPGQKNEAPHVSNFRSSLHRRMAAGAVSALTSVSDSSSPVYMREAETSTAGSGDESCTESSTQPETRNRIANSARYRDHKTVNSRDCAEREENQEDDRGETGGEFRLRYLFPASAPAHWRVRESPLSSDAIFRQSHAGLFNLCIVVLVAVNSRLIIENIMKYGLLIRSGFWFSSRPLSDWPLLMCCLTLPVFPLGSFVVEKMAWNKSISNPLVISLHVLNTTASILWPAFMILKCDSSVVSGLSLMLIGCIVWLKLVSYAHTNYDLRALAESTKKDDDSPSFKHVEIAEGTSLQSLTYFMMAPTLCYQPTYPRSTCIRKGWVTRQAVKLVIFTGVMGFIVEQYINPIVKNSQHPLKGNFLYAAERVLKLSVPNLYVWLCMFYCFFHLWLNILAELLRFGDREFYKDWWNAKTVEEYWRMWNMPVHKWMLRHVYLPCLKNGLPKMSAVVIAFLISAIFHELLIAVPCHIFKFWAFLGIMFQVPLVILTNYLQRKFKSNMVGNMVFWTFFSIFGQPMCVLLYYHDVMNRKVRATNG